MDLISASKHSVNELQTHVIYVRRKKIICKKIEVALWNIQNVFLRFLVNLNIEAYVFFSLKPSPHPGEWLLKS